MKRENEVTFGNHRICMLERHRFNSFYGIENTEDESITILRLSNRKYRKIMKAVKTTNDSEVAITNFKHIHVAHEDKRGVKVETTRGAICIMSYKSTGIVKVIIYAGEKTCQKIEIPFAEL